MSDEDKNKIRLLHDVQRTFQVDEEIVKKLAQQIEFSHLKEQIERFFKGYKVEDSCQILFASFPWVKLIHRLDQKQLPSDSKKNYKYQVPDYILYYETSKREDKPLIIEVKKSKESKETLEIDSKQLYACENYVNVMNTIFLIAIFWEKYQIWTLNSLDQFEKKSRRLKLKFIDAFKNNTSSILGDVTFIVTESIYRRTIFDASKEDTSAYRHKKYGIVISDEISVDSKNYTNIEPIESAIIDAAFLMKVKSEKKNGNLIEVIEESEEAYLLQLSDLILRHLALTEGKLEEKYALLSRRYIIEIMKQLNVTVSFQIPKLRTNTTDRLFKEAFEDTFVWKHYLKGKR